jgi:hypothetical protein
VTGLEWVTAACEVIGVKSPADGDLSNEDASTALFHGNLMRKSWNAKNLALHTIVRATFTWPTTTSSRTIGPSGAQLTGTRPLSIPEWGAKVIPAGATYEVPVEVISHAEYASIGDKTLTSDYFTKLLYEPSGATTGTLTVWPVPSTAPTLILHHKSLLAAITSAAEISAPEGYEAALVTQLAKRLAPIFGKPWTQELEDLAREDWATAQRANIRVPDETPMPAGFPRSGRTMTRSVFQGGQF